MTCPHKHVEARIWLESGWAIDDWLEPDALICRDCGEWLGLGESDDSNPRVHVEMNAANIEARFLNRWICEDPSDWPWSDCPWADKDGCQCRQCEAEDLARIMAEHEQRPQ